MALFSVLLPESCAFPAKRGRGQGSSLGPQSGSLDHPPGGHLSSCFGFTPALRGWVTGSEVPGEPVGVGCGQSGGEKEEGRHWQSLCWLGKGCEGWNAEWEGRPRPLPTESSAVSLYRQGGDTHLGGRVMGSPCGPQIQATGQPLRRGWMASLKLLRSLFLKTEKGPHPPPLPFPLHWSICPSIHPSDIHRTPGSDFSAWKGS